jgi:hypothetical protein
MGSSAPLCVGDRLLCSWRDHTYREPRARFAPPLPPPRVAARSLLRRARTAHTRPPFPAMPQT